jgi:hypothetical protein
MLAKMAQSSKPPHSYDMGEISAARAAIPASVAAHRPLILVANLRLEEPDAVVPHVRICGSPGRATARGDPSRPWARMNRADRGRGEGRGGGAKGDGRHGSCAGRV